MSIIDTDLAAKAFSEWERRYREEPSQFQSEAARLLKETPATYGEAVAPYFLQIVEEVRPPSIHKYDEPLDHGNYRG